MLLRELDRLAQIGVLIAAASHHEQRDRTRVVGLQELLRVAGVVGVPLVERQRSVVTRVAEHDGAELPVFAHDAKHRHRLVHGAVRIRAIPVAPGRG